MNRNDYNTVCIKKERIKDTIVALILLIEIAAGIYLFTSKPEPEPETRSFKMVNADITWEGAGYDGFRARQKD